MRATIIVGLLVLDGACGSDHESTSGDTAGTEGPVAYCAEIDSLMSVLDGGGSAADYDAALIRVSDVSPPEHETAWALLLALSQEPFDYENFNPAVDALDGISADLDANCSGIDRMIVDDAGRLMRLQPD